MRRTLLSLFAAVALVLVWSAGAAQANPEKVFAGKILVSDKKFPTYAKSASAYVAALRKQSKTNFWEDKQKQTWKIYLAAFFKKPLNDLEVVVKLYELQGSSKTMLASFEQYIDQRGQKSLLSQFTLDRKQVGVNKHVLMVIESQGRAVASAKFKILGEAEVYSGKVDFSDEDTKKTDDDE